MTTTPPRLRVGVVGGSLCGLFHAVVLGQAGAEVTVWERTAGRPQDRGAGIVLQPSVASVLARFCGVDARACSVPVTHRQFLDRAGRARVAAAPQHMISWSAVHRALRAAVPERNYRPGRPVATVEPTGAGATVGFAAAEPDVDVDLVVVADGAGSTLRPVVTSSPPPRYAGYVAYRGVLPEADLDPALVRRLAGRFTFHDAPGTQFLCYFIPGATDGAEPRAATVPGRRALNWVWYVPAPPARLAEITTDRDGRRRSGSVPPGLLAPAVAGQLVDRARADLPGVLADVVEATADPFAQAITDAGVPVMRRGSVLLSGDAAFVVRPHTAAATEKAAAEAIALHHALTGGADLDAALRVWETRALRTGRELLAHGVALGSRLGLTAGPHTRAPERSP